MSQSSRGCCPARHPLLRLQLRGWHAERLCLAHVEYASSTTLPKTGSARELQKQMIAKLFAVLLDQPRTRTYINQKDLP